jgi:hypothetical protein
MHHDLRSEFEVFLVEDVILTLGNLRGSLSWLGTSQSADPAIFRAGLDRLDRQIGLLEDRARALKRQMVDAAASDAASGGAERAQDGVAQDGRTGAAFGGTADLPSDEVANEASVDLEVGPDASSGSKPDAGHCLAPSASANPAQPLSDDGDGLNIFGSDSDLLPDPSWSPSPVPFRSRRSGG